MIGINAWNSPKCHASRKVCRPLTRRRLTLTAIAAAKASIASPTAIPSSNHQSITSCATSRGDGW
jgi:hypothetical protein